MDTPEQTQQKISEIRALRKQAKRWGYVGMAGVVLIALGAVGTIVGSVNSLVQSGPKQDEFLAQLRKGMDEQVVPQTKAIASRTISKLRKDITVEIDKAGGRAPELIDALNLQIATLRKNIPERGGKVLAETVGMELKKRDSRIRTQFPELTETQISSLAENLVSVSHESMDRIAIDTFGSHMDHLAKITLAMDHIAASEPVSNDDEADKFEVSLLVLDLVRDELAAAQVTHADTKAPVAATTGTKK